MTAGALGRLADAARAAEELRLEVAARKREESRIAEEALARGIAIGAASRRLRVIG
jgi:hypothetical protein